MDAGIKVDEVDYDYYYEDEDLATIPGKPGRDYPIYDKIPKTGFNCKGRNNLRLSEVVVMKAISCLFTLCTTV